MVTVQVNVREFGEKTNFVRKSIDQEVTTKVQMFQVG